MQRIPGGNLRFWRQERKVSTVGKGVGGGRCSRVEGLGVVRIMEGAEAQGSTLLTQSGSPNLLG